MELLSKTRKFKDKADELKLAIKSIHQLTRDITESLYVLKLEYEATQKDAHITTLTRKIDDMSIQIEQLLTYGKSSNQMLENISSRVIVPITQQSHQEVFILLHLEETRYYTIRAQERAAKTATDRIYSMYPNARKVLTIYGNANSVSTGNAMRKDLKKAGASVNGNDIDIGDAFDEKALVNYINKLYKNRLK
jgi:TolA-binding protein